MVAQRDTAVEQERAGLELFAANYRPLPGIFDEMMDHGGRVRAHWQPFLAMLAAFGAEEINRRFAAADRYLRGSGVFYRVYEDVAGIERPWPLSHVPLIVEPSEWKQLEAGVIQRAELLEAVLADAYGPSLLSRDGRLPAALIAGNPEFLRPMVGVAPPGGAHLRFYAVDVGRGADGRWSVSYTHLRRVDRSLTQTRVSPGFTLQSSSCFLKRNASFAGLISVGRRADAIISTSRFAGDRKPARTPDFQSAGAIIGQRRSFSTPSVTGVT